MYSGETLYKLDNLIKLSLFIFLSLFSYCEIVPTDGFIFLDTYSKENLYFSLKFFNLFPTFSIVILL